MKFIIPLLLLFVSSHSYAGFECAGNVKGVTLVPNGEVYMASFKNWDWLKVCNVSVAANGVTTEACKAIFSLLLTAQTTNKQVKFWLNDGSCAASSQVSWTYLKSWYFGPELVN